ncbi:MAG TPA: hypothetical protein VMH00_15985 [Candidatus Limnocylindrales bacterium]|nr:hypothetical protein [Candidatus Limnocylindrales bacterium]
MPTEISAATNRKGLGTLWILYALLRIAGAALLVVFSATATLMAGALLTRVPDPLTMMSLFHVLYWIVICHCIVCALLGLFAGRALLAGDGSARRLAVLASLVSLPEIPFGLVLGTYTLFAFSCASVGRM